LRIAQNTYASLFQNQNNNEVIWKVKENACPTMSSSTANFTKTFSWNPSNPLCEMDTNGQEKYVQTSYFNTTLFSITIVPSDFAPRWTPPSSMIPVLYPSDLSSSNSSVSSFPIAVFYSFATILLLTLVF